MTDDLEAALADCFRTDCQSVMACLRAACGELLLASGWLRFRASPVRNLDELIDSLARFIVGDIADDTVSVSMHDLDNPILYFSRNPDEFARGEACELFFQACTEVGNTLSAEQMAACLLYFKHCCLNGTYFPIGAMLGQCVPPDYARFSEACRVLVSVARVLSIIERETWAEMAGGVEKVGKKDEQLLGNNGDTHQHIE